MQDNWADRPVEMLFSSLAAKELGISVDGMDWWTMDNAGRSNNLREDKMFQHVISRISGRRRILIITGISHVPEFTQRFRDDGFSLDDFPTVEKEKLFTMTDKERLYPAGTPLYPEKRIELDKKAHAEASNPKIRSAFKNSVEFRSHLLQDIKVQGERQSKPSPSQ